MDLKKIIKFLFIVYNLIQFLYKYKFYINQNKKLLANYF